MKEKAIELVNKFLPYVDWMDIQSDQTNRKWAIRNAKNCALITINELINATQYKTHIAYAHNEIETTEYWLELKQEVELL